MRTGGTAIWQGFDFTWRRTPHRLNHLGSWLDELDSDEHGARGLARSRLTVGRVPDRGVARTYVAGFSGPDLHFVEGAVEVTLGAGVGEAAVVDAPRVVVPLDGADVGACSALLRGFELVCTSHPAGVHVQGLGVRLKDQRIDGGCLTFVPEVFLHANNSPDPLTLWKGPFAYRARVLYTVVRGAPGAAACTLSTDDTPCVSLSHERRPPRLAPRVLQGRDGFANGALGLRGFRFDQLHRGRWARDGRYLRRFHAYVGDAGYDPRAGRLTFQPQVWFSNAGMVSYPVRAEHRLWTTLVQFRGPRPVHRHVVEHQVGTGLADEVGSAPFALETSAMARAS